MKILRLKPKINPKAARFVLIFISTLAVLYFLSVQFESYIPLFNMQSTAQVLNYFLKLMGMGGRRSYNQIIFTDFTIQIVRQCTGIFEVMTLAACIIAFPSTKEQKFTGVMMALPTIYFLNMARLILLTALGIYHPAIFDAVHDYLLQLTFVFLVIFFWIFWINKIAKGEKVSGDEKVKENENK